MIRLRWHKFSTETFALKSENFILYVAVFACILLIRRIIIACAKLSRTSFSFMFPVRLVILAQKKLNYLTLISFAK